MTASPPPVALTIAGSDPSGGAGIQADLKTFHRFGAYGTSALALLTVQNTTGVTQVELLAPELVVAQIDAVAGDLPVAAAKTGALGSAAIVRAVAGALRRHAIPNLVVDPVMISKHGHALLDAEAVAVLLAQLVPQAVLLTPNRPEAAALLGGGVVDREADVEAAARALVAAGARAVLIKGGHASGDIVADLLVGGDTCLWLRGPRIETPHTHGTGCSYAAAITARLAHGDPLEAAVRTAHAWIARAIANAPALGHGQGPIDHWS